MMLLSLVKEAPLMNTARLLVPIFSVSAALAMADESAVATETNADADAVRLDTVQISGQEEPLAEISTKKLLRVPGAGYDPLRAIGSLPGVTIYQWHGIRTGGARIITG